MHTKFNDKLGFINKNINLSFDKLVSMNHKTSLVQRQTIILVCVSKIRPALRCCRWIKPCLYSQKIGITSNTEWIVETQEQQPLFGVDGKYKISLRMWKESLRAAENIPRGEAYGESVIYQEDLDNTWVVKDISASVRLFSLYQALVLRAVKTHDEWMTEATQDNFPLVWPTDSQIDRAGVACLCGYITDELLDKFYRGEITDKPYWCQEHESGDQNKLH